MKTANFLLCLVAIVMGSVIGSLADDGRIVDGFPINITQAPYMVRVIHSTGHYCGGTLVHPSYVVTAAHCMYGQQIERITIEANVTRIDEVGIVRNVTRMLAHPEYNSSYSHSDIAVMELDRPIVGVRTIELCRRPVNETDVIQVSGWGREAENKPGSLTLMTIYSEVRSEKICEEKFGNLVEQNKFCAGGLDSKSPCIGDSGGPAVFRGTLCGVVSSGHRCGIVGYPTSYTNVYAVKPFIEGFMRRI